MPLTRLLTVSLTDTFGRTFIEPFAEMADRYDVWLVTVGDMVRDWQIVCTSKAAFVPPPTGEECAEENPQKVMQLGDPFEPERDYAYEATAPNPSVVAFVFDPDGRIVAKRVKRYLTPTELGPDEGALGLDLVPGAASDSDSVPVDTPVGRFAFVISKPAWMPDVLQKIDQRHTDVLLQPEFFVGDLTSTTGMWSPDTLLASGYSAVLRHPSIETLVHPQMQGGVFSFYADQPSHIAVKPRTGAEDGGFILGQPEHSGLVQTLPWVVPDPLSPDEPMDERRRRLGEAGEALAPGSGVECPDPAKPGPCEDGHTEGALWRDIVVNRKPRYRRYRGPIVRTRFSAGRPLARSRREQRNAAVAVYRRHVVAAYEERRGARDQVFVVRSADRGRTWSRPVHATGRPAGATDEWWPAIAAARGGRVTLAWVDGSSGRERVYYARSRNRGRRFGPPRPLDPRAPDEAAQWKPALAAADGRRDLVHAAYIDERAVGPDGLPQAHVYTARIENGRATPGAISTWNNRIELLAMVEDTHDGRFYEVPPTGGGAIRPNAGPVAIGLFDYTLSEASIRVREQADDAMRRIVERSGLGRFMKLTQTQGGYASHPLGGCRMADTADFGVVDHRCEAFGNEGLFCMDSSAIPTSLGVNPSLTIAAVCERAAEQLVARGGDLGLPAAPEGFRHRRPGRFLGERYVPRRGGGLQVVGR